MRDTGTDGAAAWPEQRPDPRADHHTTGPVRYSQTLGAQPPTVTVNGDVDVQTERRFSAPIFAVTGLLAQHGAQLVQHVGVFDGAGGRLVMTMGDRAHRLA